MNSSKFYPPIGYNSAEISFLYEGFSTAKGDTSLLIYLANKGYIKIEKIEEKGSTSKNKCYRITKIKEYDGNNKCEKEFFNSFFNDVYKRTSISYYEISDYTYGLSKSIRQILDSKENKNKIFEESRAKKKKWIILLMIIIFCIITIKPIIEYSDLITAIVVLILTGLGFPILFQIWKEKVRISIRVTLTIWALLFSGIPCYLALFPALVNNFTNLLIYIGGIICIMLLSTFTDKRTTFGNEILEEIEEFKNFIKKCDRMQLESLSKKNPEYFYEVLPYSYALDLSDILMKKFEDIPISAPSWYSANEQFNIYSFNDFIKKTLKDIENNIR